MAWRRDVRYVKSGKDMYYLIPVIPGCDPREVMISRFTSLVIMLPDEALPLLEQALKTITSLVHGFGGET
jgi:hypothetical protein